MSSLFGISLVHQLEQYILPWCVVVSLASLAKPTFLGSLLLSPPVLLTMGSGPFGPVVPFDAIGNGLCFGLACTDVDALYVVCVAYDVVASLQSL